MINSKHWKRTPTFVVLLIPLVSHFVGVAPLIPPKKKRKIPHREEKFKIKNKE